MSRKGVQTTVTMNLAFITKRYDTMGGTEQDLFELTRRLAAWGHEVHVYCSEIKQDPEPGLTLHAVPTPPLGRSARLKALAARGPELASRGGHDLTISYARILQQDVIRCGGGIHAAYLKEMKKNLPAWKTLSRCLGPYHFAKSSIEARQYSAGNYRKIIAISQGVKREILDSYPVRESDIEVIFDGVDLDRFHPGLRETERSGLLQTLGIPDTAPVFLFVGNAFKRKGLDLILTALAGSHDTSSHLIVVGGDSHQAAFIQQAAQRGCKERVHFVGKQPDPAPYYASADFLLLPSIHEAFGNVVLESMACGTPVILTSQCGAAEILQPPLRDWILEGQDEEALSNKLEAAAAAAAGCREESRRQVESYSMDAHARRHEALFQQLIDSRP